MRWWTNVLAVLFAITVCGTACAARIKDLCEIQGARGNTLKGTGLVVGLAGTGDKTSAAVRAQQNILERMTFEISSLGELKTDNTAVVLITAELPPFAKEGTRIDVKVSSLFDCKSLEGGILMETLLYGVDDNVYAVAQGPVSIGGFNAGGGGGTSVRQNHATVGRIPMGAYVEREVPATITDGQRVMLIMKDPDFITARNIVEALDTKLGPQSAAALGAGAITVTIPPGMRGDLIGFIASVQELDVAADVPARVVINERTGTIVIGGEVRVRPCQVAHGNLTVTIAATPVVSQPLPFSDTGVTVVTEIEEVGAEEKTAFFAPVEGASAAEVARVLNDMKITPRDMIAVFQAIREAGALEGDLEIM